MLPEYETRQKFVAPTGAATKSCKYEIPRRQWATTAQNKILSRGIMVRMQVSMRAGVDTCSQKCRGQRKLDIESGCDLSLGKHPMEAGRSSGPGLDSGEHTPNHVSQVLGIVPSRGQKWYDCLNTIMRIIKSPRVKPIKDWV